MNETEITSLEKYTELEAGLHALAAQSATLAAPDKKLRLELRNTRVKLEKIGKFLRDDYNQKAKAVIAKEKELIAIILPAEERLKSLEDAVEAEKERLYRVSRFEARSERMETIGYVLGSSQNELMDDVAFEAHFQACLSEKNEKSRLELEAREQKVREEEQRQENERQQKEWEEQIRKEEGEKQAQAVKDAEDRAARAEKEAHEKALRDEQTRKDREEADRIEKERRDLAEKKKLEADVLYQTFMESHGCTEEDVQDGNFIVKRSESKIYLYKIVGELELE